MIVDFVARVSHLFLEKKRNEVTIKFMEEKLTPTRPKKKLTTKKVGAIKFLLQVSHTLIIINEPCQTYIQHI